MSATKEYYHDEICRGLEEQRQHLETLEKEE
jgi:hypothetical protein